MFEGSFLKSVIKTRQRAKLRNSSDYTDPLCGAIKLSTGIGIWKRRQHCEDIIPEQ